MQRPDHQVPRSAWWLVGTVILATLFVAAARPRLVDLPRVSASDATHSPYSTPLWALETQVLTPTPPQPGEPAQLEEIRMLDAQTGWAIAAGDLGVLRTTDGGRHWHGSTSLRALGVYSVDASAFVDADHAWANLRSPRGTLSFHTADGGRTWIEGPQIGALRGARRPCRCADFLDPMHGWVAAIGPPGDGGIETVTISSTVDGGRTWRRLASLPSMIDRRMGLPPQPCPISGISFASASVGFLTGGCEAGVTLEVTRDGGATWSLQPMPSPASGTMTPADCLFTECWLLPPRFTSPASGTTVMFAEMNGGLTEPYLMATTDGGRHWRNRGLLPHADLQGIGYSDVHPFFLDSRHGWNSEPIPGYTFGEERADTVFWATSDGGAAWTEVGRISRQKYHASLDFVDPSHGWAVLRAWNDDVGARLAVTDDGGHSWRMLAPVYTGP